MGSWQLEVGRMILYISFPIGMFHIFNHSESIKEELNNLRDSYYTPEMKKRQMDLKNFIEEFNKENQMKQLKEMEEQYHKTLEKSII